MRTRRGLILATSLLLVVAGLWILTQSPTMARAAVDELVRQSGGSLDTNTYLALLGASAAAYRMIGGILLAVGLARVLWLHSES